MPQSKVIDKKGMDAIFSGIRSTESGVIKPESEHLTTESGVRSQESVIRGTESGVDTNILDKAIKQGIENPRISSWNPLVMAVLRYRNLTTPAYSMSKEISELLESAVKERYPELSEEVEKALAKK